MFHDDIKLKGHVRIELRKPHGVTEVYEFDNLVVTPGKAFVASRMVGDAAPVMSHMAIGTDNTAPAVGQTALVAEVARVAQSPEGSAAGPVVTYLATFGANVGTGAIVEAGVFNDGLAGDMLSRVVFPVVNKQAADGMSITWTITVT